MTRAPIYLLEVLPDPSPEENVAASFQEIDTFIEEFIYSGNHMDMKSDERPKHQVILSCWRAVKEAK
ncbi:14228_t:CDS:2 [Cetraspora pellucida]|uniref:14228_t:CDS:1 n=1 Tax=Cetraspora pellucida TaxID=1433469 RepID=A0A9N9E5X8_9GLOM|nr:14228_t:CDS:2 [Cetraspora pellucida]